jgi:phospholipid/cholesterol/gamma-HCH transport system permease protein
MAGNERHTPPGAGPDLEQAATAEALELRLSGDWSFASLASVERLLGGVVKPVSPPQVVLRCADLTRLDLAGALLLRRTARELQAAGAVVAIQGGDAVHRRLLDLVERWPGEVTDSPRRAPGVMNRLRAAVVSLGQRTVDMISDVGRIASWTLLQLDAAGVRAIPIVALVAFLMGVVLAYQGAIQLATFGAELLTVDLVAIAMWREMAGLLAAIIVAGRSGSAFAATLGSMQLREEVDALRVIGVDPLSALVAPRMAALLVALPVLTVLADVVGLFGAWVLSVATLDITTAQFLARLRVAVDLNDFLVGLVKVPVFAIIIAGVGTLRGMQVQYSAEELGRQTTRAVVESITAVIVADALFSVVFAELGI